LIHAREVNVMSDRFFELPEAPAIPGLRFRGFAGEVDYPEIVRITVDALEGDGNYVSVETIRTWDAVSNWVDPAKDRIIAEVDGRMIGCGRVEAGRNLEGERIYLHSFNLVPAWRGKGIGTAVLLHNERRLREIAKAHPNDGPRFFQSWSILEKQAANQRLLLRHNYRPIRHSLMMVRPHTDRVPDCPLPPGVEIRPVEPAQLSAIWEANKEAFRDHWNFIPRDGGFEAWSNDPDWRKDLSAVAWDGDQCVGMVLGLVSTSENEKLGRRRMWTESICVRRPWRNRGVARALIAHSLRLGHAAGFVEASLGVDAENLSGALRLYTSMGYETTKKGTAFRKPLDGLTA
jgi:GNAT superfamily N-acetyltransferase